MGEKLPPLTRRGDTSPKPKLILFYKNGDRNFRGHHLTVTQRRFRNFESLLSELTRITNLPQGARFLFHSIHGTRINSLDQLQDGQSYVASSNSKFKKILYNHAPDGTARNKTTNEKKFISPQANNRPKIDEESDRFPTDVKPRLITVVRNGVGGPTKCASVLLNKRTAQSYNQVLNNITETLGGGAVWKLFTMDGKLVKGVNELLTDASMFIAVGSERFRGSDVPMVLAQLSRSAPRRSSNTSVSTPTSIWKPQFQWKGGLRPGKHRSGSLDIEPTQVSSLKKLPKIKRTSSMHSCNGAGAKTPVLGNNTPVLPGIRASRKTSPAAEKVVNGSRTHTPTQATNGGSTHDDSDDELNRNTLMNKRTPLPSIGTLSSAASSRSSASKSRNDLESCSGSNTASTVESGDDRRNDLSSTDAGNDETTQLRGIDQESSGDMIHVDLSEEIANGTSGDDTTTDEETEKNVSSREDTITSRNFSQKDDTETEIKNGAISPPLDPPRSSSLSSTLSSSPSSANANDTKQELKPTSTERVKPSAPVEPVKFQFFVNQKLSSSSEINSYYDVGEILGDGNFAVVKTAVDRNTNTQYALKVINAAKLKGKEDMLGNEIHIQRTSRHPNLVQLLHDFHSPTEIFLVMELITGGDLFDLIAENIRFEEDESAMFTRDICSGLDYLHRRNIVHRDIKPENLMVSTSAKDGTVSLKIADFGLAQKLRNGGRVYTVCGTPTYVSPEILKGEGYGVEVDVWAVGVIMYIMLCGFPPFRSPNRRQTELFDLIESGEYEYLEPYWDDVSELAKDVISRVLVVNVLERFTCEGILAHEWLTQFNLTRNNTMDATPAATPSPAPPSPSKFRSAVKGVLAMERMKKMVGDKLERGENFIENVPSRGTTATTSTDTVT